MKLDIYLAEKWNDDLNVKCSDLAISSRLSSWGSCEKSREVNLCKWEGHGLCNGMVKIVNKVWLGLNLQKARSRRTVLPFIFGREYAFGSFCGWRRSFCVHQSSTSPMLNRRNRLQLSTLSPTSLFSSFRISFGICLRN